MKARRNNEWSPFDFQIPLINYGHGHAMVRIAKELDAKETYIDPETYIYAKPDENGVPRIRNRSAWLVLQYGPTCRASHDKLIALHSDPIYSRGFAKRLQQAEEDSTLVSRFVSAGQQQLGRPPTSEELHAWLSKVVRRELIPSLDHALMGLPAEHFAAACRGELPVYGIPEQYNTLPDSRHQMRTLVIPFWALQAIWRNKEQTVSLPHGQLIALATEPGLAHFGAFGYLESARTGYADNGKNAQLVIIPERLYQRAEATRITFCEEIAHRVWYAAPSKPKAAPPPSNPPASEPEQAANEDETADEIQDELSQDAAPDHSEVAPQMLN